MLATRYVVWGLLAVGCVGLAVSVGTADSGGAGVPPQKNAVCTSRDCNKIDPVLGSSDCPLKTDFAREDCLFDSSQGMLVWCDPTNGQDCQPKSPITSNKCTGYCEITTGQTCYSANYNVCVP